MSLFFNPAIISILLLCILCLKRVNVLLAIIISTLVAGLLSGMNVKDVMNILKDINPGDGTYFFVNRDGDTLILMM